MEPPTTATHPALSTDLDEREAVLDLPDGRRLSYALLGAHDGPVVVVLDGPGSRGLARGAASAARELGLRLVAPDRPGFFASTPASKRGIADWPADHAALLDALGAERARPWPVDIDAITVPVALWSGDRDVTHPTSPSHRLAARLGGAPVHVISGAATFGLMPYYADALRFATPSAGA